MTFKTFARAPNRGLITILAVVFSGIFVLIISSLVGFIFAQHRLENAKENQKLATEIAEAGLNYYKWFLAHFPNDLTDGTGGSGPYVHTYNDPEGSTIGEFSLEISGKTSCGDITSINIDSTGYTYKEPSLERKIFGKYARPSVAEYAYIINSNVWAGSDREIKGPYHSNGGIRMDGENQSVVTSAVENWFCSKSFGCNPAQTQPGIFGGGSGSDLWEFPSTSISFGDIAADFINLKNRAVSDGVYLAPSLAQGYHVILRNDNTFDLYRVDQTSYRLGLHIDNLTHMQRDYYTIKKETFLGNTALPANCSLIFIEDTLWLEGEIDDKTTIVAADLIGGTDPDIILNGNIVYKNPTTGENGLTAIAEHSVLIPPESPDAMELRGIFIAQGGYFGRNLYACWDSPYDQRSTLEVVGSIISNQRVGTKWGYCSWSCGCTWSGYNTRENSYDRALASDPPPFTPYTSQDFKFVEWREERN